MALLNLGRQINICYAEWRNKYNCMSMTYYKLALRFIILSCIIQLTWSDLNPEWESPDAFSQRKTVSSGRIYPKEECVGKKCQASGNTEDDSLPSLYRKLVKFILKREKMKFDESSKIFYRSLHLYIKEEQLHRFEKMNDPHDMDQLISEVLYQSRSGAFELFQEMYLTWRDILIYYWDLLRSSRQGVIAIQFAGFVLIWFASKKFKFRFSVVGMFLVLFYLYNFLDAECHRKKEIERTAQMFGMNNENPCESSSFWTYYFRNQNDECKKYLENSYDTSCTLVDIYEEFVSVFVYKQMWNFINNSVGNILKVYATYGIVGALVVAIICVYLIKNCSEHVITSTFRFLRIRSSGNAVRQETTYNPLTSDVLNKLLDITKDQTKLNALHLARLSSNSGVQQIDVVDGNDSGDSEKLKIVENKSVQITKKVAHIGLSDTSKEIAEVEIVDILATDTAEAVTTDNSEGESVDTMITNVAFTGVIHSK